MKIFTFAKLGRALLVAAAVVAAGWLLAGCDGGGSELVGQWVNVANNGVIDLFKDGTGVAGNGNIFWKVEGKRFALDDGNTTTVGEYKVEGYEFKWTLANGGEVVWVRKDKLNEYVEKKKKQEEAEKKQEEAERKKAAEAEEQRLKKLSSYFTDSRNGQKYRAVKIGEKRWMAENLNYQTGNSWCYGDDESKCKQYGRLYDWSTAKTACPEKWHLPTREEWNSLVAGAGGDVAGKALKSVSGKGTDAVGFSALPGGYRYSGGTFYNAGDNGYWWTATEGGSDYAYRRRMNYNDDDVDEHNGDRRHGFSVRCVED